jgi:hypothetical protein
MARTEPFSSMILKFVFKPFAAAREQLVMLIAVFESTDIR